jgi:hypothetical protein
MTVLLSSTRDAIGAADSTLNSRSDEVVAREIALSGLADAESALLPGISRSTTYSGARTFARSVAGGSYSATITTAGVTHTIRSAGTINGHTATVNRVYQAELVPGFMGRAGMVRGNFEARNDLTMTSSDPERNADLQTNSNFTLAGGTTNLAGFGLYGNNLTISNGQTAAQAFRPQYNPTGLPVAQRVPPVPFPTFVAATYLPLADRVHYGELRLNGNITLGTREDPLIWYVDGTVVTTGPVTVSGYGVFIVTRNLYFGHNVLPAVSAEESMMGLYVQGNIEVQAPSLTLTGQMYAHGNILTMSNTRLRGSFATYGNLQMGGPFLVEYVPASSSLTELFWPQVVGGVVNSTAVAAGVKVTSYREW